MPELPEVETVRRGLAPELVGRALKSVAVSRHRLRWPVAPTLLAGAACNSTVVGLRRRGKYLLLDLASHHHGPARPASLANVTGTANVQKKADWVLIVHLGMSGWLGVLPPQTLPRKHDHVAFLLDDGRTLCFNDPRRFGAVLLCASGEERAHPLLAHLGPEPLAPSGFDGQFLWQYCRGRSRSIKSVLMDARCVVGVGNIYANEALFLAGIDPRLQAGRLSRVRAARLVAAVRQVLDEAIHLGGTTLRDFRGANGLAGLFAPRLRIYGKAGSGCGTCAGRVTKVVTEGRATYLCRRCQRR